MNLTLPVRQFMTTDLITIQETTPYEVVKRTLDRRRIHHILVENHHGKLVGIISSEDTAKIARIPLVGDNVQALHIMQPQPKTIQAKAPLSEALEVFLENKIRGLPVLDEAGDLVGILTVYDLLQYVARQEATQ